MSVVFLDNFSMWTYVIEFYLSFCKGFIFVTRNPDYCFQSFKVVTFEAFEQGIVHIHTPSSKLRYTLRSQLRHTYEEGAERFK